MNSLEKLILEWQGSWDMFWILMAIFLLVLWIFRKEI